MPKFILNSKEKFTKLASSKGLSTWEDILDYVRQIPYGRSKDRLDFGAVLSENKGTCSSKHALLKSIADENKISNIDLILCIYKMNESNTPGIGNVMKLNSIKYIPEAHCFLKINDIRVDFTSPKSNIINIENDILEELKITPNQVSFFKVAYHKAFKNLACKK